MASSELAKAFCWTCWCSNLQKRKWNLASRSVQRLKVAHRACGSGVGLSISRKETYTYYYSTLKAWDRLTPTSRKTTTRSCSALRCCYLLWLCSTRTKWSRSGMWPAWPWLRSWLTDYSRLDRIKKIFLPGSWETFSMLDRAWSIRKANRLRPQSGWMVFWRRATMATSSLRRSQNANVCHFSSHYLTTMRSGTWVQILIIRNSGHSFKMVLQSLLNR